VNRSLAAAIAAAGLLGVVGAGCGKHEESRTVAPSGHQIVANPSSFPLYAHSDVMNVVPIDSAQMFAAMKQSDPSADVQKNFRGHEVIAQNGATMVQLKAWLASLRTSPPGGLRLSTDRVDVNGSGNGKKTSSTIVDGAEFETPAKTRDVYVFVADPDRVRAQLGVVFGLIDNYSKVPEMLRGPIDEEAKKQVGYSVTELLDAKSPVGAAVAALKQLQGTGHRAIVVVDTSQAK
jgi:hypothetical protein